MQIALLQVRKDHKVACILAHRGDLPEPEPLEEDEACEGYEKTTDVASSPSETGPRGGGAP